MGALKRTPFGRQHTGTFTGDQMQRPAQRTAKAVGTLATVPFLQGVLLRVSITAFVNKTVRHGIGVPAAFMIVRHSTGTGEVYEVPSTTINENVEIVLGSDATGTWDLWFYPRQEPEQA